MRFQFLGAQVDERGQDWCYILDTQTGATLKSPVKQMGTDASGTPVVPKSTGGLVPATMVFPDETVTAPAAVKKDADPAGDIETPEQRAHRITHPKVPVAFSQKMMMDPAKSETGVTDVTTKM